MREPGVIKSVPPSDESDTEWNEEMDDAGTCLEPFLLPGGIVMPSFDSGGYAWSTVSESDFLRAGSGGTGSGVAGMFGLRTRDEVDELDTDLREL